VTSGEPDRWAKAAPAGLHHHSHRSGRAGAGLQRPVRGLRGAGHQDPAGLQRTGQV